MKRELSEGDIVRHKKSGNLYYVERLECVHNVDSMTERLTGEVECRPYNSDDNLPDYNKFNKDDLELQEDML